MEDSIGIGRRKKAVASVRLRQGTGKVNVNNREFNEYFPLQWQQDRVMAPFQKFDAKGSYDIIIRVKGGGVEAQATAVRLGIARALVKDHDNLHADFKEQGFLTRDPRKKERKKYGRAGARKRFQFSKR